MPSKIKKARISRTGQGYHHDLDPYTLHDTKALATADRSRLFKIGVGFKSRQPRVTTFYTVLQDRRKNNPTKFASVPQGPHTFPHHGIFHAIVKARQQGKLDKFDALIPDPNTYKSRVDQEIPVGHPKRHRAEISKIIFKKTYQRYDTLRSLGSTRTEPQNIKYAHTINRLLQIDPYGSYAYKGKGAGRKALKTKGESSKLPLAQQIDLPAKHGFSFVGNATTRNNTILSTLSKFGVK